MQEMSYRLYSRATDYAGNMEDAGQIEEVVFTWDTQGPLAAITAPIDGGHYNSITQISGTARDGVGIAENSIEFTLRDIAGARWYNGASFSAISETWLKANNPEAADNQIVWSTGTITFTTNMRYGLKRAQPAGGEAVLQQARGG